MRTPRPAFTLIELLVVIVIISLLTAAATASFVNAQRAARDNARKTTVSSISVAVETYYRDKHAFPGDVTAPDGANNHVSGSSYAGCYMFNNFGVNDKAVSYAFAPAQNPACNGSVLGFGLNDAWIPGLGPYMSSPPIDTRFLDRNGLTYDQLTAAGTTATPTVGEVWKACDTCDDKTRTYVYRHIQYPGNGGASLFGYVVYTRLEGSASSTAATLPSGTSATVLTAAPAGNVYAVIR